MTRRVRVVTGGEDAPEEVGFADTARALLERALAQGAVTIAILWETPRGVETGTIPPSRALLRGLLDLVGEAEAPSDPEPEEDG